MKILLTGATGFLGSHLVEKLTSQGHEIKATIRASSQTDFLNQYDVELFQASLFDSFSLKDAVSNSDVIIHAAGGGKVSSPDDYFSMNVNTTACLLESIKKYNPAIKRFVHVSSLSAHGPSQNGKKQNESMKPHPVSLYGKSKQIAEQLVNRYQHLFPTTIIRPPAIYGPRDTRLLALFKAINRGILPIIGQGGKTSIISGMDCASAIEDIVSGDKGTGNVYFVEDGNVLTFEQIGKTIARALNKTYIKINIPISLFYSIGICNEIYSSISNQAVPLTRDKVLDLQQSNWICSSQLLQDTLGWKAKFAFEEGIHLTAQGYKDLKWL